MGIENGNKGPDNGEFTWSTADALEGVKPGEEAEDIWGDKEEVDALAEANAPKEGFFKRRREQKVSEAADKVRAAEAAAAWEVPPQEGSDEVNWDETFGKPEPQVDGTPAPTEYGEEAEDIWGDKKY